MLINNASIVTGNSIIVGDILIENNRIAEIGKGLGKGEIDASKMIAIPGLINTHTHVAMTTLRGLGEDMELHKWLSEKIWPKEKIQSKDDIKASAKLSFLEMIKSGTTAFSEMCIHDTKEIFEAANEMGLRGVISQGAIDFGQKENIDEILKKIKHTLNYKFELVKPSVSVHATNTCSKELIQEGKKIAQKNLFQIHVSETREEIFQVKEKYGLYPVELLSELGVLDENSLLIHCSWLTKREISMLKNVNISSCPVSNLKLATGGIAQLNEMDSCGANVSLGTDSAASNNSLNMFETMKFASLLQKHHYWKANVISAKKIFDFATKNGAKAIKSDCGSIEVGKLADIVLIDKGPNMYPEHNIFANLVYCANPSNVRHVIINGKHILNNGYFDGQEKILETIANL